ncbi:hypothetical protein LTR84_012216 [Exophiala bonariae]|uniref:Enoyl reductase (ER) domain-containing protein n=1 Tax=Exophiala bonariae TaxID=1690606 RepID=A0AAV9NG01_9EURO|nr:hypothetical protein LTR84_012216 [Exophiala bonariae]
MANSTALIVTHAGAPFRLESINRTPLQAREVLVRLKATGVCHTDNAVRTGKLPGAFPLVLGHEGAGVVEEVGSAVKSVKIGDHVLLSYAFCRTCGTCKQGKPYACVEMERRNFSCSRPDGSCPLQWEGLDVHGCFFGQSSFANPAIVQESSCVPVDPSLPLEILAPLGCGIQTGSGTVFNIIKPVENDTRSLVVFGLGGVGCAAIMAASYLAKQNPGVLDVIIAVDLKAERLELARQLGATHSINGQEHQSDLIEEIRRITGGVGADAAVDCTGALSIINDMIVALAPCGRAVTVGAPPLTSKMSIEVFPFINGCKSYRGSHQGDSVARKFLPFLADLYQKGEFPIDQMERSYPVGAVNEAVQDMLDGKVIKPVLIW